MDDSATLDWRPGASLDVIKARAQMLKGIRAFFDARGVLEVETPVLSRAASSEVHLASWYAYAGQQQADRFFLQTSPELAMKRLLAAGCGDIYQVCKVFRAEEKGQRHNPEFSLLEWYRVGFDLVALMQEVNELLTPFLSAQITATPLFKTYQQVFIEHVGCDPLTADKTDLIACYKNQSDTVLPEQMAHQDWLDLIMTTLIEPRLPRDRLVFITHFPAAQASLAQLDSRDSRTAKRFEVFFNGLELANGFEELTDANEQRQRMLSENAQRVQKGLQSVILDERFLAAMAAGLPACSGVALGLDRLLMLVTQMSKIDDVLTFAIERA